MSETLKKFYLTTPIYYVNARPHIGHAYSTIAADVIARRHRLLGDDTFFLTGTDEHGLKVQRSAEAAGIPPQQFANEVSATFRSLWKRMGITNDDYIRTTEERHKRGVQKLWTLLEERGAIYLSSYTGQYSVGEEMFVEGPPGTIGPDGKPTETVTEENYFFRLSDYQQPLLDLIESGTLHIQPEAIRNEVLSFIRGGLKDVSISRTSVSWGVPVPGNEKHSVYVWFDALINYITAIGYGSNDPAEIAKFEKYWPADIHMVGKEITRFHCVYWPAFLLAAGIPVPKAVVANGWLLFEDSKMSKSRGNVVRTETILDAFGALKLKPEDLPGAVLSDEAWKHEQDLFAADILRYFLLREIPFGQDGSFSFDALVQRYNSDLANGYGNLVSRTLTMIGNYFGEIPEKSSESMSTSESILTILDLIGDGYIDLGGKRPTYKSSYKEAMEAYEFARAIEAVWGLISVADGQLSESAPWKLAKIPDATSRHKLAEVLYTAAEGIRIITALLYPVLPYATASVWQQLGLGDIEEAARNGELKNLQWGGLKPGTKLGPLSPIFPRADKGLIRIMNEMEQQKNISPLGAAAPSPEDPTHPAAPPRTSALSEVNPGTHVAASAALTTERPGTPTHQEAPASGAFANAAAASAIPDTPQIAIDDFVKIDLRVAQIIVAERIPKADKLLRLEVDLGYEKRQILSGIAEWYTPEELVGRRIVIIANLAPRKMRGLESHGMLLAASADEHGKPVLATFTEDIALGSRLR